MVDINQQEIRTALELIHLVRLCDIALKAEGRDLPPFWTQVQLKILQLDNLALIKTEGDIDV